MLDWERILELRAELHVCPEPAFAEKQTKETILRFLREQTQLEVVDRGAWCYARWNGGGKKVAFRADFDAVPEDGTGGVTPCFRDHGQEADQETGGEAGQEADRPHCSEGQARHLCGHDGHAAVLCGLACWLSDHKPAATVYLIFQPAEEIGEGAKLCRSLLAEEKIPEIYGFHNIPGFPRGAVLVRRGTFACASTGLELSFHGEPSHAAYPEDGRNPAKAVAELILWIRNRLRLPHEGILLCTVIGAEIGGAAYGVSAGEAVLRLTVRGEKQEEFDGLVREITLQAKLLAQADGLELSVREIERFPATVNTEKGLRRVLAAAGRCGAPDACDSPVTARHSGARNACDSPVTAGHSGVLDACDSPAAGRSGIPNACDSPAAERHGKLVIGLEEPMRWSEDFGYYLEEAEGAFFGIGDGEVYPQLHTQRYSFPDEIIPDALEIFVGIVEEISEE